MARTWTKAQLSAINIKDKTLLVSAAAGSGKTSTLTERIIQSITDPVDPADISKMLIVTFTRASAADLRSKILSALNDALAKDPANKHLNSQLIKLGNARICTIDSFYLDIIRSNFAELGLSPSFRIADTAEIDILSRNIMTEIIDVFYEKDEEFPLFAECFSGIRNSDSLSEVFLNLYSHTLSIPEGIEFLRENAKNTEAQAELDFFATEYGKVLKNQVMDSFSHYFNVFDSACQYFAEDEKMAKAYLNAFSYQRDFCLSLIQAIDKKDSGYKDAKALLNSFAPPRIGVLKSEFATDESNAYKEMRTEINAKIREISKKSFSKEPDVISRAMRDTAKYTHKLYDVLSEFGRKLDEEKVLRNFLDFSDIRRYTLKLLVDSKGDPTPVALKYAQEFSYIYIDEYQDVDKVQDLIFRSISKKDNRFMVGDIKQSIYSFRGAEPQVFADYRNEFADISLPHDEETNALTVFMSENFRCDKNVVEFTNLVCSYIFSAASESIGYTKSDDLVFSKALPSEDYISPQTQVAVISSARENDEDDFLDESAADPKALEAKYIAAEINRLIATEKKADGSKIIPGDIAVLFRARSMSRYVADALAEYGIRCSENDSDKYFENADVLMVLCVLNVIDNPQRDIFLTGALRSPIFDFSMEDIIRIRRYSDGSVSLFDALSAYAENEKDALGAKCVRFLSVLDDWRCMSLSMPVDKFLRFLFDTEIFVSSGLISAPTESGGGNLLRLYEYARNFENGSFKGLYQFIEFINTLIDEGQRLEAPPQGHSPDKVSLMTIHQSKGLEFPVCFVAGTASKFNTQDQKESLLFEYPLGAAMKIADSSGFARINTPMREAVLKSCKIKQTEEEMRVLYVALTRARERLYVTASTRRSADSVISTAETRARFGGRHILINCTSYMDWILTALSANPNNDCYSLNFIEGDSLTQALLPVSRNAEEVDNDDSHDEDSNAYESMLRQKFSFTYPYADFRRIPAKISVSKLSPDILDDFDISKSFDSEITAAKKAVVPDFFISGKTNVPTAAEKGIATHLFFQFCDFKNALRYGTENELHRLIDKKFIPQEIADIIYKNEIETFFSGELIGEILNASKVIREQRFNILLPADEFTSDKSFASRLENERIAVQGVIDLILVDKDGNYSIFDYKTDRLTKKELESPPLASEKMSKLHSLQLSYYARATEMIFGKPPQKICIYSTHAAHVFDIKASPLTLPESLDIL